jgi:hypothetical protein
MTVADFSVQIFCLQISLLLECEALQPLHMNILRLPGKNIYGVLSWFLAHTAQYQCRTTMSNSDCKRRKVKALLTKLTLLTGKVCAKFELVQEVDSNPTTKTFGKEFLILLCFTNELFLGFTLKESIQSRFD